VDANTHPAKAVVLLRDEAAVAAALRQAVHRALGAAPASLAALAAVGAPAGELRFLRPLPLRLSAPRRRRGLRLREGRGSYATDGMAAPADDDAPEHGRLPALEPLAQFEATLLLARSPVGHLFLVDQHRAHERVLYERLRQRGGPLAAALTHDTTSPAASDAVGAAPSQLLLQPLVVELTPGQAATLQPRLELLRSLGLDCQPFGGSVFLVRAVPQVAGAAQAADAFAETLLRDAAEESASWLDTLCASLACRAAVRRGQALSHAEQRALLADLAAVETTAVCPHGSPLLLRYTRGALARAFEW
jgi:DNA mismatch repair protein MutL